MGIKALIADDDSSVLWVLERVLVEKGIECVKASDGAEASALLASAGASLAIFDINMPGKDGLTLLKEARDRRPPASVIIMTAEATMKNAVDAMKHGAFDYVPKPFDIAEIEVAVERAMEDMRVRQKAAALSERLKEKLSSETVFIGKSRAMQAVYKTVGRIASSDVTALVLGPSGTGKELVARLIHLSSSRADGPFVAVNAAAIPKDLMESELFGFEKGAFTGAVEARKGKFELADGGTIFFDEIGDMAPDLQSKLLRVLQEKEFYRVGGKEPVRADARVVAATNQDVEKLTAEGRFREDLFYRLSGVTITLPPLSERKGDIPALASYFLDKFAREQSATPRTLSPEAMDALTEYHWPGNVRELENVLRRAVLLNPDAVLKTTDLMLPEARGKKESIEELIAAKLKPLVDRTSGKGRQELYDLVMPYMERPLIRLVLEKTGGNQVQAAELLGINRNTLRTRIKELGIKVAKPR